MTNHFMPTIANLMGNSTHIDVVDIQEQTANPWHVLNNQPNLIVELDRYEPVETITDIAPGATELISEVCPIPDVCKTHSSDRSTLDNADELPNNVCGGRV